MLNDGLLRKFNEWLDVAKTDKRIKEPTAMSLATVNSAGQPSNRTVLLKEHDANGFVFYTNYGGRKSVELSENPRAALQFYWMPLMRQIRIQGAVEKVSAEQSDAYFASRPRGSQIGAWASDQSQPLDKRSTFEARIKQMESRFDGEDVPRPEFWGGWRIMPDLIEFWEELEFRRHNREQFTLGVDGQWQGQLLYP